MAALKKNSRLAKTVSKSEPKVEGPKKRGRKKGSSSSLRKAQKELNAMKELTEMGETWLKIYQKIGTQKPEKYDMRKQFAEKQSIEHKTLGWGYVLANRNDRLEVLFKDGVRHLISNYQR